MPPTAIAPPRVVYPETDGMALPEGGLQADAIHYAVPALRTHFASRADVFVAGNMFIYDEEGNPRSSLAPDVFVVYGVPNHSRQVFLLWEERTPDFVLEIASASTARRDRVEKPRRYAALGVTEYWQYDPSGTLLDAPLRGAMLDDGQYVALPSRDLADGAVQTYSPVLGLYVRMTGETLRFRDPETGCDLRSHQEEARARQEEARGRRQEARARQQETRARQDAERRVQEETRARQQETRARQDAERRVQEETRARQQETRARQDAERRLAVMEARVRALQRSRSAEPPADDRR